MQLAVNDPVLAALLGSRSVLNVTRKLPTGCIDIVTTGFPNGRDNAGVLQALAKSPHSIGR